MVPALQAEILSVVPQLRRFAVSLCRNRDQADDLVQDTLLRAYDNIARFAPGTNMGAWLITILRNQFYSECRKRRRAVQGVHGIHMKTMAIGPEQIARAEFEDLRKAFARLPSQLRETLILVGVNGLTYPEAASICGCPVGTVKSRVHRARACLAAMLCIESAADFSADASLKSILAQMESGRAVQRSEYSH